MRIAKTFNRPIVSCAVAGAILAIGFATLDAVQAQTPEYTRLSGQLLVLRLVKVRINAATEEIEEFHFEEPLTSGKWSALGCRMKLANHPYLQQAIQRGFMLRIQSQTRGCIQSYEIGRDENLIAQTTTAPPSRTPILTVTATGALAPRPPFTPIRGRTRNLTVIGTGALAPHAPFTPISVRTDTLTVTGTGSR